MKNGLRDWLKHYCHLSIGPLGFTPQGMSSLANKVVESWEIQIPVVTQKSNPISELNIENLVIPINSAKRNNLSNAILGFIKDFESNSSNIQIMIEDAYHYYKLNHSPNAFSEKLLNVLNDLS